MTELHVLCDGYVREAAGLRVGSTVGFVADGNALVVQKVIDRLRVGISSVEARDA